jgi:hypothetical protein
MTQTIYISAVRLRSTLVVLSLAVSICISSAYAEDLKTESGRIYRDATISRVDGDGLVIKHRFGIVKVAFKNIAAESREKFNPQKAAEQARNARRDEEEGARDRTPEVDQQTLAETAERRRFVMAFEEDAEAEAEAFASRIHQNENPRVVTTTAKTFHIRGQIVAAGPTGYIVHRAASRARGDSDFLGGEELIFVTSDINEFVPGDYMDVRASADGRETTFSTYLGEVYPGRFPIYRIIRDRRPEICVGFIWYGTSDFSPSGVVRVVR